ncbi:uncharacterized protein THITE_2116300 [Thermothielavioides terrestris NRRL 8126]|uniref:Amine oxidase domain-containing protein n=1 Tax=Thermothielavioides terrestris (strain ATCC 38088 / NRRL 8126) TaxID=578455 RepID=G2R8J1_THETT|nr:uncharacterized protein THITE_2116300 [Thermothielavioides terrestris NRRL 8126]AEO67406.1 hypothetical protein THITE_2116300 [Thermothielavioides terrestris NRRL 8126]
MVSLRFLISVFSSLPATIAAACADQFDPSCYASADVLTRNVAVIGGGSSGTYAAVKLRDAGRSVVVIEKQDKLGGKTETYTVPGTGTTIDYGVQVFWNTSVVTDFFSRLNVPIAPFQPSGGATTTVYVDLKSGQFLSNFTPPSSDLSAYRQQLDKYPYLSWGYDIPTPVPEDLSLPFGRFITKYGLQDVAFTIFHHSATGGLGNILQRSTVSVLKALSEPVFQESQGKIVVTAAHNNHQLYDKALEALGRDVLLNSTVVAASRPANSSASTGVRLVVKTPTGNKLVIASQILFTAPQTIDNLSPFDLDRTERLVFSQFNATGFYAGLLNNTGLPTGHSFINAGLSTQYHIPSTPGLYHIQPTAVQGIWSFWYTSDSVLPEATVKREVLAAVNVLTNSSSSSGVEILAFANHSPYLLYPPAEQISQGFYSNLESLQGYRNTWYTGGLFEPAAGPLWVFTQALIEKIAATVQ